MIPGLGRLPGEGKGYPLQYSGLGVGDGDSVPRMCLSLVPVVNIFISHARKDVGGHTFASVTKPMTLIELATLSIKSMHVVHFMGMLLELEYRKGSVS